MWWDITKWIFSYFKSPNRVQIVEIAETASNLATEALNEVRSLRADNQELWNLLQEFKQAEEDCKERLKRLELKLGIDE